jgi:dihydroorotase-like cyclic amidohydrolase
VILADARVGNDLLDIRLEAGVIAELAPAGTLTGDERIEADGRWLVPGLWDQHVHFSQWAMNRMRVDLAPATSADSAAAAAAFATAPSLPQPGCRRDPPKTEPTDKLLH